MADTEQEWDPGMSMCCVREMQERSKNATLTAYLKTQDPIERAVATRMHASRGLWHSDGTRCKVSDCTEDHYHDHDCRSHGRRHAHTHGHARVGFESGPREAESDEDNSEADEDEGEKEEEEKALQKLRDLRLAELRSGQKNVEQDGSAVGRLKKVKL